MWITSSKRSAARGLDEASRSSNSVGVQQLHYKEFKLNSYGVRGSVVMHIHPELRLSACSRLSKFPSSEGAGEALLPEARHILHRKSYLSDYNIIAKICYWYCIEESLKRQFEMHPALPLAYIRSFYSFIKKVVPLPHDNNSAQK